MPAASLLEVRHVDITLVITLHAEDLLAYPSLVGAARCADHARDSGFNTELLLALDRPTAETRRVVRKFMATAHGCRVLELNVGDVGASRNAAVGIARGRVVAICDGDDLLSANFLTVGAMLLDGAPGSTIVRPHLVVQFDQNLGIVWQASSGVETFDPACLVMNNQWTTACMSHREVFEKTPYWVRDPAVPGFGYEDWNWNCETIAAGASNVIAPETAHYVRIKAQGSMNSMSGRENLITPPNKLFELMK